MTKEKALEPAETAPAVDIKSALLEIVQRKDIDPERLEKFLELQIKMENRQAQQRFNEAFAAFQGECPVIVKKNKVSFGSTNYDYAALDEIVAIAKPLLKKHGLSYSFNISIDGETSILTTIINHADGYTKDFQYYFDTLHDDGRMNVSQRRKSAVTYAKRAALENALGIVTAGEDDDARRAIDNPMSEGQATEIREKLSELDRTEEKFLSYFKNIIKRDINTIDDLTFKEAATALIQIRGMKK